MSDSKRQPNLFPVLRYQDAPAAIRWLVTAFGFETRLEVPAPEGTIAHAELRLGPGAIGISSKSSHDANNPWSSVDQNVYVCVKDPDALHDRAKAEHAELRLGTGVLMLSSSKPSDHAILGSLRQAIAIVIDDPDSHHD
jgi:uncharacterized glyoxalase superfamily protein PhnB